jgi:hypothetical protein
MTPFVRLWLWISAFASLAGWALSAAGQLNRPGYVIAFAVFAIFVFFRRRDLGFAAESTARSPQSAVRSPQSKARSRLWTVGRRLGTRYRRPLPLCFAALAVLIFLGGAIHAPGNYTGLAYRAGRVLQWLAHGGWFWIHTADYRMNDRACGVEWLSAPILLFTHSTRGLFLLNFLPFLLLPGLIFSIFTRLGVRARVAWAWMWLLPTGYNFILQAGGNANDTFPTVYALAAMDFALRAWKSRWVGRVTPCAPAEVPLPNPAVRGLTALPDLWHSGLAAALLTGAKPSNLPLLLPWALVFVASGAWRVTRTATFPSLVTRHAPLLLVAAAVSFLPTAILNAHFLGDWSGLSVERAGMAMKNPAVGVWGNAALLLLDNFTPPLFPFAGWWNAHALAALPHFISAPLTANFEQGFLWLGELPTEDWAGLGFGLSVLLAVSVAAGWMMRRAAHLTGGKVDGRRSGETAPDDSRIEQLSRYPLTRRDATLSPAWSGGEGRGEGALRIRGTGIPVELCRLVALAPWISLLAYGMKSGMNSPARLIAPYYPLLLPLLLVGAGQSQIVRRRWWRALAGGVVVLAFIVLILTPDRPLWPAQKILSGLAARHPNSHLISRALEVYSVYAQRSDPLADVRPLLPPNLKAVGFIGAEDDCDISLWLPLGSRRVEHFLLSDPPELFRQKHIEYVVLGGLNLQLRGTTLDAWRQKTGAELVARTNATLKVSEGPQEWFVVRFPRGQ